MVKRLFTLLLLGCTLAAYAQQRPGSIRGTVTDKVKGETLPFANVVVKFGESIVSGRETDIDGNYNINPVEAGTYTVEASYSGYATAIFRDVIVSPGRPTILNFQLQEERAELIEVEVVWEKPLVDGTKTSFTFTADEIINMPTRDVGSFMGQVAGVYNADEGQATFVRGGRSNTTTYFVDGVKVRGPVNIPRAAIAQMEVITGGLPAQYGDATGGVVATTTRGPTPTFFASGEALSSSPFDQYHFNLGAITLGGPLLKNAKKQPIVGFLFAGEYQYDNDPFPSRVPVYRVKDDVLERLQTTPIRPVTVGSAALREGEFLTQDDLTTVPARMNVARTQVRATGNLNIRTSDRSNVIVGGRFNYFDGNNASFFHSLMNWENNGATTRTDWSAFVRFQQSFGTQSPDGSSSSLITNSFLSLMVDYTRNSGNGWDSRHRDNIFAYGHIGSFATQQRRFYAFGADSATGITGHRHILWQDVGVNFTPGPHNPVLANYTNTFYSLVESGRLANLARNWEDIIQGGGLVNGFGPQNIYGLWGNVGTIQSGFSEFQNSQFRATGSVTFDIKNHSLIAGFEYERRIDRSFSLAASPLWTHMRQLQNDHIRELDFSNPQFVFSNDGVYQDTINYPRLFDANKPRTFDRNVRLLLGLDPDGLDWLDIDRYDPSFFSLNLFSANELLNIGGTQFVNYYGFDYTGNVSSRRPSLEDFFNRRDANGNLTREVAPFEPIYFAGYIQDQFAFNDLFFNVGVRLDYYDANQPVLRDPLLLYNARTASQLGGTPLANAEIPANIGDDYVVYVNDIENPTQIVGFRSGINWYNADGALEANPGNIARASNGIKPYLLDPSETLGPSAFQEYDPQITVSPRVSFQFPISDRAQFFAHYDLLFRRPDDGLNIFNPINFMQLDNRNNSPIYANPNLLPQKTTDYELGFQQILTQRSALKISAFYREMRDMMQVMSMFEAYPITYLTYGNLDYGTVKGFTLEYDLRRTGNIRVNANYTLQFADGTGSGPNTGANLARSGQPNLRYILPLSFDTRHMLTATVDYRYGSGASYNGPEGAMRKILENAGAFLQVNANSGTPFTRRQLAYPLTQQATQFPLEGQINGARLPWQFRIDATLNKIWNFKYGEGNSKKGNVEVFFTVTNLLNTINILSVYPYTGNAFDDGFLVSPQGRNNINFQTDAQSYVDLYNVALVNPGRFALPRRMRIGVRFNI
jgi:outer membrane receptor protein involved in Fe transport